MRQLRNLLFALLGGLVSAIIILGSLMLSMAEGGLRLVRANTPTPIVVLVPGQPTLPPQPTPTLTPAVSGDCAAPDGWTRSDFPFVGELTDLAADFDISVEELLIANCLEPGTRRLPPNAILNVPLPTLAPTLTATAVPSDTPTFIPSPLPPIANPSRTPIVANCIPYQPSGWIVYVVRSGDTLFRIAYNRYIGYQELMRVNCLTNENIRAGQRIYVPFVATRTVPAPATPIPPTPIPPTNTLPVATNTQPPATAVPPSATYTPTSPPASATLSPTTPPSVDTPTFTPTTPPPPPDIATFTPSVPPPTATFTPTTPPPLPSDTPVSINTLPAIERVTPTALSLDPTEVGDL